VRDTYARLWIATSYLRRTIRGGPILAIARPPRIRRARRLLEPLQTIAGRNEWNSSRRRGDLARVWHCERLSEHNRALRSTSSCWSRRSSLVACHRADWRTSSWSSSSPLHPEHWSCPRGHALAKSPAEANRLRAALGELAAVKLRRPARPRSRGTRESQSQVSAVYIHIPSRPLGPPLRLRGLRAIETQWVRGGLHHPARRRAVASPCPSPVAARAG